MRVSATTLDVTASNEVTQPGNFCQPHARCTNSWLLSPPSHMLRSATPGEQCLSNSLTMSIHKRSRPLIQPLQPPDAHTCRLTYDRITSFILQEEVLPYTVPLTVLHRSKCPPLIFRAPSSCALLAQCFSPRTEHFRCGQPLQRKV